jgi:hypothetical protein
MEGCGGLPRALSSNLTTDLWALCFERIVAVLPQLLPGWASHPTGDSPQYHVATAFLQRPARLACAAAVGFGLCKRAPGTQAYENKEMALPHKRCSTMALALQALERINATGRDIICVGFEKLGTYRAGSDMNSAECIHSAPYYLITLHGCIIQT